MKKLAATLLCLAFVWVAWRIIVTTAANSLAVSHTNQALWWNSNDAGALDQLARQELAAGKVQDAKQLAAQSMLAAPADAAAVSLLGIIAERQGDTARATALMELAGARAKNDLLTQAWLFDHDFRRGDYVNALPHIDAIMRAYAYEQDRMWPQFLPALAAFTVQDRSIDSIARFLARRPIWRGWILANLSGSLVDREQLTKVYDALGRTGSPASADELRPFLNRLIKDEQFAQANRVWRGTLPQERQNSPGLLYNGDFSAPINGLPFNWVLKSVPEAEVQVVDAPESEKGRALQIEFSGARISFANVYQLLMLPPGQYRLSGQFKATNLSARRGLWWRIFCAKSDVNLAETDLLSRSARWTSFSVDFTVPSSACEAQWLRLENPARVASEQQIAGEVWYRELQIATH